MKVFWSWQSDNDEDCGHYFVRDALKDVAKHLNNVSTVEAVRGADSGPIQIDHDVKGLAGSPPIAEAILEKIREAAVFIADVTPVGQAPGGKRLANPNVMLELGYAIHALGHRRIVLVVNCAENGGLETLPFDLRHWKGPVSYALAPGASKEMKKSVRKELTNRLRERIVPCLSVAQVDTAERRRRTERFVDFTMRLVSDQDDSQLLEQVIVPTLKDLLGKAHELKVPDEDGPRQYRRMTSGLRSLTHSPPPVSEWTREEVQLYNSRVRVYHEQCERHLIACGKYLEGLQRSRAVRLELTNTGTLPATNLDAEVWFPEGLRLFDSKSFPPPPKAPAPPALDPDSHRATYAHVPLDIHSLARFASPDWTHVDVERQEVRFHVEELKHSRVARSHGFFVMAGAEQPEGVSIAYSISASETRDPVEGVLGFDLDR